MMLLGFVTLCMLLPFVINALFENRYIDFLSHSFVCLAFFSNSLHIYFREKALIPAYCIFVPTLLAIMYAMTTIGFIVLFWAYPFFIAVIFTQKRNHARALAYFSFICLSIESFLLLDTDVFYRFLFTSLFVIVTCDLLVGILIKFEKKLNELALIDPLTEAYNRRYLDSIIENTIAESKRDEKPYCLLFIDIDYFKNINDELGHSTGDSVLIRLVELIKDNTREIDYLFRLGGEEFVILLKNTPHKEATNVAENLRYVIENSDLLSSRKITISIGVTEFQEGESANEWLHRADQLLYKAKHSGRNKVCSTL